MAFLVGLFSGVLFVSPVRQSQVASKTSAKVILTGDVMLGRTVMIKSQEVNDPIYPFRKVADRLREADIVFINLENPIIENCPRHETGFKFCASPELVQGLVFAGVDVVNLANNHAGNYGQKGLEGTKRILEENGIRITGLGNLTIEPSFAKASEGKQFSSKIGFLGFNLVDRKLSELDLKLIRESDIKVDVLVVGVHWGVEYTSGPTNSQKLIAKSLVEAGADVIAGHHPHWAQDMEYVNGKPVYYSLGNFVFDQMWSEKTRQGLVVRLTIEGDKIVKEERLPIYMKEWAQPEFLPHEP